MATRVRYLDGKKPERAAGPIRHLTTEELAERLGLPADTVKRWRRTGDGPAYIPIGKHVRYRLADIEAWERSRLVPAPQ